MVEFTANSGAKVKINIAPFEDSQNLLFAMERALKDEGFDMKDVIGNIKEFDLKSLNIWPIAKLAMAVDCSKEVNDALWTCLARCSRNGDKITKMTFEPVDARQDYYEIIFSCIKENIVPLGGGVSAVLKKLFSKPLNEGQR